MKKILFPLFTVLILTFSSCNGDDDKNSLNLQTDGMWTLVNASGGFSGTNQNFKPGAVTMLFNDNSTVAIQVNDESASAYVPFENGTYSYAITPNTSQIDYCKESIKIGDFSFFCYSISANNELIIDSSPVDGLKYTFKKF